MRATYYKIVDYIFRLESKIAFYPAILSLLGVLFAIFMYYIESLNVSRFLLEKAPWLILNNADTARTLLSTFIGGLISIMVFSFSMVMILLNQASSNYSPRVLPGLISNRRHQIILGIYNSSLLYYIFTLIAIEPTDSKAQTPGFSILLAIIFMISCLAAFIYFVHSISQEIQINNIMSSIFSKAKGRLNQLIELEKDKTSNFPNSKNWHIIKSTKSGYLEDISLEAISEKLKEKGAKAEVLAYKGQYVFAGYPIIKTSVNFDEETNENIFSAFHFSKDELIEENYLLAFKQLAEIILKAMSPGVNDPGTAINAIDYLTELLLLRMQKKDFDHFYNESDELVINTKTVSFELLLFNLMAAIRTYCKHDVILVQKLLGMFKALMREDNCVDKSYRESILREMETLHDDVTRAIENKVDLRLLESEMYVIRHV